MSQPNMKTSRGDTLEAFVLFRQLASFGCPVLKHFTDHRSLKLNNNKAFQKCRISASYIIIILGSIIESA